MILFLLSFYEFRKCDNMRFCRDNLNFSGDNDWSVIKSEVKNDELQIKLAYKQEFKGHIFHISTINNRTVRFFLELPENLSSYRYDVFHDDLIVYKSKLQPNKSFTFMQTSSNTNSLKIENFEVIFTNSPFTMTIYKDGVKYIELVKSDNFMIVEDGSAVDDEYYNEKVETIPHGKSAVGMSFAFDETMYFSGLSIDSKTTNIDDTNETRRFNVDAQQSLGYAFVPFLIAHDNNHKEFPSVFWINPTDTFFSIETKNKQRKIRLLSEGGFIDFVVIIDSFNGLMHQYTDLTGRPEMPPGWALGYQQSKWGYKNQSEVEEMLHNLTINGIPHDGTWLDIDHLIEHTPLTMDPNWFYDSNKFFNDAKNQHRAIIRIMDPHMKVDTNFTPYNECSENNYFVQRNGTDFVDDCWPGKSSWPDYLRKEVREWWSTKFTPENGFPQNVYCWNDMNEPSTWNSIDNTFPKDSLLLNNTVESREVHGIYGLSMVSASHLGQTKRGLRPFVLTRSYFAGSQKFAWHWSGDNSPNWDAYKQSIDSILTTNLNAMYFTGSDLGGFMGNTTTKLLTKWYQLGSLLYPLYREHSIFESAHREPYLFKETEPEAYKAILFAIKERYAFLPLLYTAVHHTTVTGEPFVAPPWFYFPEFDHSITYQPIVGGQLMLVPQIEENQTVINVTKPPGRWYDMRTGIELKEDNRIPVEGYDRIPAYLRGGTITANFSGVNLTVYETFQNSETLLISADDDHKARGYLYFDDLETTDYKNGKYLGVNISFDLNRFEINAMNNLSRKVYCTRILIFGLDHAPYFKIPDSTVLFDGNVVTISGINLSLSDDSIYVKDESDLLAIVFGSIASSIFAVVILIIIIVVCTRRKPAKDQNVGKSIISIESEGKQE